MHGNIYHKRNKAGLKTLSCNSNKLVNDNDDEDDDNYDEDDDNDDE